ncbi:zinc-binding dehydrogenase [Lentzea waywayandensis]|uniref:zinc-binding dehydrogenase n=1 Tax=Lentzea waywayandensis TaxID=84724 RepID=UPI0038991959
MRAPRPRCSTLLVEHDQAGIRAVSRLADRGTLRAHVSGTFPLAEGAQAHALGDRPHHRQTGHHRGLTLSLRW